MGNWDPSIVQLAARTMIEPPLLVVLHSVEYLHKSQPSALFQSLHQINDFLLVRFLLHRASITADGKILREHGLGTALYSVTLPQASMRK